MDITWPVKHMSYRDMILIPLVLAAIFAMAVIARGIPLSMDFAGGTHLSISVENTENMPDASILESRLQSIIEGEINVHQTAKGYDIETSTYLTDNQVENQIKPYLSSELDIEGKYSVPKRMSGVITATHAERARNAVIGAAIAMGIIIFIALRHFTSVGSILLVVGLDALAVFGGMALLRIPLSFGSVTGLLLLIGYAVDTNILLSTKVLKRVGGTPRERAAEGMRTGLIMSGTSATALLVLNFIMTPPLIKEFSGALVMGILADMFNTWLLNSGILLRHVEQQQRIYHGRI